MTPDKLPTWSRWTLAVAVAAVLLTVPGSTPEVSERPVVPLAAVEVPPPQPSGGIGAADGLHARLDTLRAVVLDLVAAER